MPTNRVVPFFDYPSLFTTQEDALTEILHDVLHRGAYILQRDVQEFESNLAEFLGVKYAVGVANGTDGLLIALHAAGIRPGDEVIFPAHTFVATAAAIHFAGATPVPVDCGDDYLCDPAAVEIAITAKTRAIMPVQLNGRVCKMDQLQQIADRHKCLIIEDAAQALGARYQGQCAGTFGLAGMFSFYPAKSLGCFGDGGAVVTNDATIAKTVRVMRDHGRNDAGKVVAWGLNSRLDNLHAAVLNFKLRSFPAIIQRRREIASLYDAGLRGLAQLQLPPAPNCDAAHFDTYQNYEMVAERRNQLRQYLKAFGIDTMIQWGGSAVHQFSALGLQAALPRTEGFFERCLMLPMNAMLSNDDVAYVTETILQFYEKQ